MESRDINYIKTKRIILFTQYFWPENFRINDLVSSWVKEGHEVTVLTSKPNYPEGKIYLGYRFWGIKKEVYYGADVIRVPIIPRGKSKGVQLALNYLSYVFFATLLGIPKLITKRFDYIFVYEVSPITVCLPAIVLKTLKRIPLAMWVQDLWPESLSATAAVKSKAILKCVGLLVNFIYRKCDLIFVQSKAFMSAVEKRCKNIDKIKYMPNWAEDIFMSNNSNSDNSNINLKGEFKILFAGNIGEAQDFPTILKAFSLINDSRIHLNILGNGRKKEWVENTALKLGIESKVHLHGQKNLEQMPFYFSQADVLFVSLKNEDIFNLTIPGKIQSYLASGKPILGSIGGEGARVILEAKAGLVSPPESPETLMKTISEISKMPKDDLIKFGNNGKEYFKKNFLKSEILKQYDNDINKMIEQKNL